MLGVTVNEIQYVLRRYWEFRLSKSSHHLRGKTNE